MFNTITQELLVRGFVLQTIGAHASAVAAAIGSSLFVLPHAPAFRGAWLPAVNVFAAGLLFAIAYLKTSGLWLPIGIHFSWNLLLGPVLGGVVSGGNSLRQGWQMLEVHGPPSWTGGYFGLEGGAAVTISTVIVAIALASWARSRRLDPSTTAPTV